MVLYTMLSHIRQMPRTMARYGLSQEYIDSIELPAPVKPAHASAVVERQPQAGGHRPKGSGPAPKVGGLRISLMHGDTGTLNGSQLVGLLRCLHRKLQTVAEHLPTVAASAPPGPEDGAAAHGVRDQGGKRAEFLVCIDGMFLPKGSHANKTTANKRKPTAQATKPRCAHAASLLARGHMVACDIRSHEDLVAFCRKNRKAAGAAELMESSDIDKLVAFGYPRAKCQDALEECGGDLQSAVEWLLKNCTAL